MNITPPHLIAPWYDEGPSGPCPIRFACDLAVQGGYSVVHADDRVLAVPQILSWDVPLCLSLEGFYKIISSIREEVAAMRKGWALGPGGSLSLTDAASQAKVRVDEFFEILSRNSSWFSDGVIHAHSQLAEMGFDEVSALVEREGCIELAAASLVHELALSHIRVIGDMEEVMRCMVEIA